MAEEVHARLGAAAAVLGALKLSNEEAWTAMSAQQCAAVVATVQRLRLNATECKDMAEMVAPMPWEEKDLRTLLACIGGRAATPCAKIAGKKDQPLQDYTCSMSYLTEAMWTKWKSEPGEGFDDVCFHLRRLGLKHGAERTYGVITASGALLTEGKAKALAMGAAGLWVLNEGTKKQFRTGAAMHFIEKLPDDPQEFRRRWPDMWECVFPPGSAPPVEPFVDSLAVDQLLQLKFMRRAKGGWRRSAAIAAPLQLNEPNVLSVANTVLHTMQQMQEQQHAFMSAWMGMSSPDRRPLRRLQTLPDISDSASPSSQLQLIPPGPKRLGASLAPQLSSRCQDKRELTNGPTFQEVPSEEEQADRREETAEEEQAVSPPSPVVRSRSALEASEAIRMCMYSKAALAAEKKKKKEEKAMQKAKAKQAVADQALVDKAAA